MTWNGRPADKSLFHSRPGCDLPIGNLTSQVFANFYLNSFDHFIKHHLGLRYYGRYVDDFVVVHPDRAYLNTRSRRLPAPQAWLDLHPRKIYLQYYTHDVKYLGVVISIYIANRTKGNFYRNIQQHYNLIAEDHKPTRTERATFPSNINSYLGIMKHYNTYSLRKHLIFKFLLKWWCKAAQLNTKIEKVMLKS